MPRLLVVHHSPSPSTSALLDRIVAGAGDAEVQEAAPVSVIVRPALEASADDVLAADGYVLLTPANFGYMSGALKHFFDTVFLEVGGALDDSGGLGAGAGVTAGRPWGLVLHGRYDLTGARRSVESIVTALGWRTGHAVVGVLGRPEAPALEEAYALGATIAALVGESTTR